MFISARLGFSLLALTSAMNVLGASVHSEAQDNANQLQYDPPEITDSCEDGYCYWRCKNGKDWCKVAAPLNYADYNKGDWIKCKKDEDCAVAGSCQRKFWGGFYELGC